MPNSKSQGAARHTGDPNFLLDRSEAQSLTMELQEKRERIEELEAENERLREALLEIQEGAGPFSRDPLTHAENTIDHMIEVASRALDGAGGQS